MHCGAEPSPSAHGLPKFRPGIVTPAMESISAQDESKPMPPVTGPHWLSAGEVAQLLEKVEICVGRHRRGRARRGGSREANRGKGCWGNGVPVRT
jgi:hypothetical protein